MKVRCKCGVRITIDDKHQGKRAECSACGRVFTVPAPATMPNRGRSRPSESDADRPRGAQTVRCQYCHERIPRSEYRAHVAEHIATRADGQQNDYATLPPEERAAASSLDGVPHWYRHKKCGVVTGMPDEIRRTYLKNAWFYNADWTHCTGCRGMVAHSECVWVETGENLYTYFSKLRQRDHANRPGMLGRIRRSFMCALFKPLLRFTHEP